MPAEALRKEGFTEADVEEGLLGPVQLTCRAPQQLDEVRVAAQQIGLPADRPGGKRLALGLRHGRQHAADPVEHRPADMALAKRQFCGHVATSCKPTDSHVGMFAAGTPAGSISVFSLPQKEGGQVHPGSVPQAVSSPGAWASPALTSGQMSSK